MIEHIGIWIFLCSNPSHHRGSFNIYWMKPQSLGFLTSDNLDTLNISMSLLDRVAKR